MKIVILLSQERGLHQSLGQSSVHGIHTEDSFTKPPQDKRLILLVLQAWDLYQWINFDLYRWINFPDGELLK